jgi:protein-S-isoprenylcysteine O-methyltransferase Ste14
VSAAPGHVVKSALGLLWFGFWFFLCFPWLVLKLSGPVADPAWKPLTLLGAFLIVASLSVVVLATVVFVRRADGTPVPLAPPRIFVSSGLYRWVRNPMYLAYALILVGEALVFESLHLAAYSLGFGAVVHVYVTKVEEQELLRRFGPSYQRYCESVPRWVPKRPR